MKTPSSTFNKGQFKYSSTKEFIALARAKFGDKVDYSLTVVNCAITDKDYQPKAVFICSKHGSYEQKPILHLKSANGGCRKCAAAVNKPNTEEYVKRFSKAQKGLAFDYSKIGKITNKESKVKIGCHVKEHGFFYQRVETHLRGQTGCKLCFGQKISTKVKAWAGSLGKLAEQRKDLCFEKAVFTSTTSVVTKIKCNKHKAYFDLSYKQCIEGNTGCKACLEHLVEKERLAAQDKYVKKASELHKGKWLYDRVRLLVDSGKHKIEIGCKEHGYFWQLAGNHINPYLLSGCPVCGAVSRSKSSTSRSQYDQMLLSEFEEYKAAPGALRNTKQLDLVFPKHKIAIEVNGLYWHSEKVRSRDYHIEKTLQAKKEGLQLLHFWDYEIRDKYKLVVSMIRAKLGEDTKRIYARKTEVKLVDSKVAKSFEEKNHLQGHSVAKVRLGLFYEDKLVALMTFAKPRFSKQYEWELIRYCCKRGSTVVGGPSKLLSYFEKNYKPKSLVSYANLRFSYGGLYKALGFKFVSRSTPNYFYWRADEIVPRYSAQKHKLEKLLGQGYNEKLSENENMKNNGYLRCYDCGNLVYEKIY